MNIRRRKISMIPIGVVQGPDVVLKARWRRALDGIEGFSHLMIVVWLDRTHEIRMKIGNIGFLATRTPHRPNPVGITVVRLIKRRGLRLTVKGLDAWDGSPVLDVKPYTPKDSVPCKIPGWVKEWDKKETDPLRRYGRRDV